jgi:hypothetical protein
MSREELIEMTVKRAERAHDRKSMTESEISAFIRGVSFALRKTGAIDKYDYDFQNDVKEKYCYGEDE